MAHAGNFLSTVCLGALCGLCFAEAARPRPTVVYTAQPQPVVYVRERAAPTVVVAKQDSAPLPALALEVPPPPPSDAIDRV